MLLSIFGKILAHLVVHHIEQAAIRTGAIAFIQFGALTRRFTVDALSILLYHTTEAIGHPL